MSDAAFATLPAPPCCAVIFSSRRRGTVDAGYGAAADRMLELARAQPGDLGVESARDTAGYGTTVSYWASDAIARWRRHAEHADARAAGRERWYDHFELRVAKVERAYGRRAPHE